MTLDDFLNRLEQTPRRWTDKEKLRLGRMCPITAVGGGRHPAGDAYGVAARLGLAPTLAVRIIQAADVRSDLSHADLRARLLKACGL